MYAKALVYRQVYTAKCPWHSIVSIPNEKNRTIMRSLLYIIAVILVIGWALGAFAWHAGNIIYILLVLAVISFLLGVIRRGSV